MPSQSLLGHLRSGGCVIGDGSFIFTLERRGYVRAGPFTPEVVAQHPEAVRQLSKEFVRAGAMVIQACTFSANPSKLAVLAADHDVSCDRINIDAIEIAAEAAATSAADVWVCGSITPTTSFERGAGEEAVKEELKPMVDIFVDKKADFLLAEFFGDIVEAEWAVDVLLDAVKNHENPKPAVGITMRIGPTGDANDVTPQECAVRLKRRGAEIIGINCNYDTETTVKAIEMMKEGLDNAGLSAFLMTQPCGFHCKEVENQKRGFYTLPEFPIALEPRQLTRIDAYDYARKAYKAGVRYIGGCCGFEPHLIRAVSVELEAETGRKAPGRTHADKWAEGLKKIYKNDTERVSEDYWRQLKPALGREGIVTTAENLCITEYR